MRARWLPVLIVLSLPEVARAEAPTDPVEPSTAAAPAQDAPAQDAPAQDAPAQDAPAQDAPAQAAPPPEQRRPFVYKRREIPPFPSLPAFPGAIGVNNPWGWLRGGFGASLYVGLSPHHAIRANAAYYGHNEMFRAFVNASAGGEVPSFSGRVIDYSAALVWYPRRRWDGFMLEIGALLRDRETRTAGEFDVVKHWTLTYAGRGMIGWSWRFGPSFIAAAVGLSVGHEVGRERIAFEDFSPMPAVERRVERQQVDGEGYLRIGWIFGD